MNLTMVVNGSSHELDVAPHSLLLDVLRDSLDLKGAKARVTPRCAAPVPCWSTVRP